MYRCPKCHAELPADARFCKTCGFNQTNARIASMPPPGQGVQRQVPPQIQPGVQQSQARTIQPHYKHVPQQPANRQEPFQQSGTNMQVPQQNFPGVTPFAPQQPPMRTSSIPQDAHAILPSPPRPQQSEVQQ